MNAPRFWVKMGAMDREALEAGAVVVGATALVAATRRRRANGGAEERARRRAHGGGVAEQALTREGSSERHLMLIGRQHDGATVHGSYRGWPYRGRVEGYREPLVSGAGPSEPQLFVTLDHGLGPGSAGPGLPSIQRRRAGEGIVITTDPDTTVALGGS